MTSGEVSEQSERLLKQMSESGQGLIGYFYPHLPLELLMAHDFVPVLVWADSTVAGAYEGSLQTFACSFARNIFSQRVRDQLSVLTGFIFPGNTCDSLQNVGDIWRVRFPNDVAFRLTYPAGEAGGAAVKFLADELRILSKGIELRLGTGFSREELKRSADLVGRFRWAVQFIYSSRLIKPDVASYSELARVVRGFLSVPSMESLSIAEALLSKVQKEMDAHGLTESVENLSASLLERQIDSPITPINSDSPRIAVMGGMVEPTDIASLMQSTPGGSDNAIVLDMLSFGFKTVFTRPLSLDGDPFEEMARVTLNAHLEPTQEGLPKRLDFLRSLLSNLSIDGVIVCEQSFCDPDQFEAPSLEKAVTDSGVPALRLPMDPEMSDMSRLTLRVQSFLETLESG
ncbi:MAG: 2-hydroxyacyl-CoA dehydratase subunit D [Candidatus Thorarchaeota archaeon]|jgi:benzoyl-CoA reductase/2-hydroxyglutaryl-CoA dehydratase subunit BcrC/BadD/HgdB